MKEEVEKKTVKGEVEEEDYIIAYDLPSENYSHIKSSDMRYQVASTRVFSVQKLHGLGIMCTESVILVSPEKNSEIEKTVKEVEKAYKELNENLAKKNLVTLGEPLIKVIKITREQKEDFKTLAERKLKERLDEVIERLVDLINEIENIVEEEKRKKIEYNVNKQIRELKNVEKLAKSLGIETNHKFELIEQLYNNVIEKLRGENI